MSNKLVDRIIAKARSLESEGLGIGEIHDELDDTFLNNMLVEFQPHYEDGCAVWCCFLTHENNDYAVYTKFENGFHFCVGGAKFPKLAYCLRMVVGGLRCEKHPIGMCPHTKYIFR